MSFVCYTWTWRREPWHLALYLGWTCGLPLCSGPLWLLWPQRGTEGRFGSEENGAKPVFWGLISFLQLCLLFPTKVVSFVKPRGYYQTFVIPSPRCLPFSKPSWVAQIACLAKRPPLERVSLFVNIVACSSLKSIPFQNLILEKCCPLWMPYPWW